MKNLHTIPTAYWSDTLPTDQQPSAIDHLETGGILFFPKLEFLLDEHEQRFLAPQYVCAKTKNVSFTPSTKELRGANASPEELGKLQYLLQRYSQHAKQLMDAVVPHYKNNLMIGRTSFRPAEISHRKTSYRKDDKRLHVDAFPASPNQGLRILRVFTNINPYAQDRVWRVGESFEKVAQQFLPRVPRQLPGSAPLLKLLKITKSYRTEYDHIMLQIHDRMKGDLDYQKNAQQQEIRFAPKTSWIVATDQVSHAAMSGQYVLEQTFYLPVAAMKDEQRSPLRILEKLCRRKLV
jgi:hypothetical protein